MLPLPEGVEPLGRLGGSQVERFGISTDLPPSSSEAAVPPSFAAKVHESIRAKRLAPTFSARQRVWLHNPKLAGYELARRCSVAVPEILVEQTTIDDLDWASLPDRFVVKPVDGAASRGIFLLERTGRDDLVDHMDGSSTSPADVSERYRALVAEGRISPTLMVEELLRPHPSVASEVAVPDDLKAFCFFDHPGVIMQRRCHRTTDRSRWRFRFWDAEWSDLGAVKYVDRLDPTLAPPVLGDEVLAVLRAVGRELAVPFVRLDVFETDRGVVFGELTPHPGPPAGWRADLDLLLGWEWEIAAARLEAEGVTTLTPRTGV